MSRCFELGSAAGRSWRSRVQQRQRVWGNSLGRPSCQTISTSHNAADARTVEKTHVELGTSVIPRLARGCITASVVALAERMGNVVVDCPPPLADVVAAAAASATPQTPANTPASSRAEPAERRLASLNQLWVWSCALEPGPPALPAPPPAPGPAPARPQLRFHAVSQGSLTRLPIHERCCVLVLHARVADEVKCCGFVHARRLLACTSPLFTPAGPRAQGGGASRVQVPAGLGEGILAHAAKCVSETHLCLPVNQSTGEFAVTDASGAVRLLSYDVYLWCGTGTTVSERSAATSSAWQLHTALRRHHDRFFSRHLFRPGATSLRALFGDGGDGAALPSPFSKCPIAWAAGWVRAPSGERSRRVPDVAPAAQSDQEEQKSDTASAAHVAAPAEDAPPSPIEPVQPPRKWPAMRINPVLRIGSEDQPKSAPVRAAGAPAPPLLKQAASRTAPRRAAQ
jgi:hypothetical protein